MFDVVDLIRGREQTQFYLRFQFLQCMLNPIALLMRCVLYVEQFTEQEAQWTTNFNSALDLFSEAVYHLHQIPQ